MFKKAMLFLASFLLASAFTYAEEKCTISGEVIFQYDGDIYICLFALEKYAEFQRPGHDLSQPECKHIRMNDDLKKAGKVSFKFESVPKGTYCIVGYQDENNNGKVDFENYSINEPWETYKEKPIVGVTWDQIKFDLEKNISGIKIQI